LLQIFVGERLGEGAIENVGSDKSAFDMPIVADSPEDLKR
jgi:hypothetical protein